MIVGTALIEPQTSKLITIPATYKTILRRSLLKPGEFTEWQEVICEADRTPQFTSKVRQALDLMGYNVDVNENEFDASLKGSLIKFQKDNGLPIGQFDFKTLESLGVR